MEKRHAPARLVLLMGKCFPIRHYPAQPALSFKIIEAIFQVFLRCPCVLRTGQSRRHLATRMNASVAQKSVILSIFLIYIYIYRSIFMGVSSFSFAWTSFKLQAQVLSPKKVDSLPHLLSKQVFMRSSGCLPNSPLQYTQDRFWVKCPLVL
jgi:hypothetical protein